MSIEAVADASLESFLENERGAVNRALARLLDDLLDDAPPALSAPVRHAVEAGGKRLRPVLCIASWRAMCPEQAAPDGLYDVASALELIHTYSLVHDDLPCMDDDDLRRGRPTTHRVYGVEAAVIAGAALIPLAVEALVQGADRMGLSADTAARLVVELCGAAGGGGMVGGQLLDLEAEGLRVPADELERIHRRKTGALLAAALRIGAIAGGADEEAVAAFDEYGRALGLAFQIADDVLDVTTPSAVLGKTAGKDAAAAKSTYPALLGLEPARARARAESELAQRALESAGLLTPQLEGLARYAVERRH